MASSTLNFQVQHQVANDVKFFYRRPNNNREIYLWYPTCTQRPQRDTCPGPGHVYRLWSGSAAVCRTYSGKSQKSKNNI